jgi:Rrf2 family cysteine metabolism transcriptional repressor
MKVLATEEYGLRAMIELAQRYGQDTVPLSVIAKSQGISLENLEQVIPNLRKAGLVQSKRGAYGGYRLARSPDKITVNQILKAVGGALLSISCVNDDAQQICEHIKDCSARTVWLTINAQVSKALSNISLADL